MAKAEQRLADGRAAGEEDKIIDALSASVDKLREKISETRAQLAETESA